MLEIIQYRNRNQNCYFCLDKKGQIPMHDKNLCSPSPRNVILLSVDWKSSSASFNSALLFKQWIFNRYGHMWPHFRLLLVETLDKLVNQQLLRMKGLPATGWFCLSASSTSSLWAPSLPWTSAIWKATTQVRWFYLVIGCWGKVGLGHQLSKWFRSRDWSFSMEPKHHYN